MTITMGPRTDITEPENLQSSFEPYGSPRKGGTGALWVAIVALVAVIGLALAAALGAFDSSSTDVDRTTIQHVDPRADADIHRTPVAPAPVVAHPQAWEDKVVSSAPSAPAQPTHPQAYEEFVTSSAPAQPSHPQAYEEFVSPASASQPYVNSGLDAETQQEIYEQNAPVDPRDDSDHHREP